MKRLFTVMMTLTLAIANWAQDEVKMYSHVYLKLHDGNTYEIPIEHGSKMHSYAIGNGTDAYFVVDITGKKCFYQFKREEIAVMKLIQDVTGIELLDYNSEDPHASMLQYKLGELRVHATLEGEQLTIVDAQGYVTADIDNLSATGSVKLGAMEWTARSTDGSIISEGTLVKVDRIEGVKAFVTPVQVTETV